MKRPLSLVICFLVPLLILVVGLVAGGVVGYRAIPPLFAETGRGLAPPGFTVELPDPGKYAVWFYSYGILDGQGYESSEGLPSGARVHVHDIVGDRPLPLVDWLAASRSFAGESAVSVGMFETARPGRPVEIRVSGLSRPAVVGVAPVRLAEVFRTILQLVGILVLSLFFAVVALIVLLHRRSRQVAAESAG